MFVYKLFLLFLSASTSAAYINSKDVLSSFKQNELSTIQLRHPKNRQSLQKAAASRYTPKTKQVEQEEHQHARTHKRWGIDNAHGEEYWHDQRIHTLGNVGFWGAVHAASAPASTKLIDIMAYKGLDVRQKVARELARELRLKIKSKKARVLDLCCGVGMSTLALRDAFPEAEAVIGMDTSLEMISMANFLSRHLNFVQPLFQTLRYYKKRMTKGSTVTFTRGNAECTDFPEKSFDLVTIMYAFHEAPREGRDRMIREARRLLEPGGTLAIIDIHSDFKPPQSMLRGEPYVLEYQKNIRNQLQRYQGFRHCEYTTLVPNGVSMWVLQRRDAY